MKKKDMLSESLRATKEYFDKLTPEELEDIKLRFFTEPIIPKGWVSIEDHLPFCKIGDLLNHGTKYNVKDKDNNVFDSFVMDHNIWYYQAKENGITHWFNK